MSTMYETIRDLPLFKGIGEEQLSALLEKTSVEFLKFEEGDTIALSAQQVESLDFILSGRVRQTYTLFNYKIEIDEILGKGSLLGALHLFGMETTYTANSVSLGRVSMMRIAKSDYMNILHSDRIYMLNFVNYLSAAVQKSQQIELNHKHPTIMRSLQTMAFTLTSKSAETVMISGEDEEIAGYCGVGIEEFSEWKTNELAHNRIIVNQRGIILKSPHLER